MYVCACTHAHTNVCSVALEEASFITSDRSIMSPSNTSRSVMNMCVRSVADTPHVIMRQRQASATLPHREWRT